jgi:hydroxyethylthiazole kinase-like uncharacterized protein yjeF
MKLVTVQEMKDLERAADAGGHSYDAMMERAGHAVAQAIQSRVDVTDEHILILVGPGNNGGDGLVTARYLAQAGARVMCYMARARPKDDLNVQRLRGHNVARLLSERDTDAKDLRLSLQSAAVVVDALLGTGVDRPLQGTVKDILDVVRQAVAERRAPQPKDWTDLLPPETRATGDCERLAPDPLVVAVDVPSGLNCDTGEIDPAALPADVTVTFGAPKRGQFQTPVSGAPGASALGELIVADIGIDPALSAGISTELATMPSVARLLPARPLDAHKGAFGKAMVVAGSVNYTGAAYLAAASAARVGTGLVTLALPGRIHPIVASKLSEVTYLLLPHNMGVLVPAAKKVLSPHLAGYSALLLGPGLGRDKETVQFVHQFLGITPSRPGPRIGFQNLDQRSPPARQVGFQRDEVSPLAGVELPPLVVDADGLNALSEADKWWTALPPNSVLTPHPGEMGRLMGASAGDVNEDRLAVAITKAADWNQIVVLKGAFTVVAAPDGRATVLPFANPALATAGTGDVLAGSIVGLLAQGLTPFDAALCGAYLHGLAGHIVRERMGDAGLLAGDLLPALPQARRRLEL